MSVKTKRSPFCLPMLNSGVVRCIPEKTKGIRFPLHVSSCHVKPIDQRAAPRSERLGSIL